MKQLAPYPLIRPGFKGLNTERASDTTIGGAFALQLTNAIFDKSGRIAARKGWVPQHPLGIGGVNDIYYDNIQLLLHMNGANAGVTFVDSSQYALTSDVSPFGATHLQPIFDASTSTTQKEYGSASYSSGAGGALRVINDNIISALPARFNLVGDFTIEASLWKSAPDVSTASTVFSISNFADTSQVFFEMGADVGTGFAYAVIRQQDGVTSVATLAGAANLCDGAWHKLAFVRIGDVYTLYVDGVRVDTDLNAATVGITYGDIAIGRTAGTLSAGMLQDGYIDNVRYTKGVARYTGASYTVPTAEFSSGGRLVPTNVAVMHEWIQSNGASDIIVAGDNKLYQGITVPVDRTGALTPTADNWQFVNFRGWVLGFQESHDPIIFTGSGPFKAIVETQGTAPSGNAACAAFGRVWAVDSDKQTIKYCALLDPYDWGSDDSGIIDMRTVWTKGMDEVVGITAFGAALVVFGKRHIIIWTDGQGSVEGMDPVTMYVADTIEGTGLAARDSVQSVGSGDVLFLSPTGLQSLARIIVNKNNPLQGVDSSISRYLRGYTSSEDPRRVRSLYNARDEFYLLILPKAGVCFCFSTREPLEDGALRASEWDSISPLCGVARTNGNVLFGFPNYLGKYSGYLDNGATYDFTYKSPWMTLADMAPEFEFHTKIPKRIGANIYTGETTDINYEWAFDFNTTDVLNLTATLSNTGRFTEYGQGEYGSNGVYDVDDLTAVPGVDVAEYGGSLALSLDSQELAGDGRWVQFGLTATINDAEFTIQQLDLYCKVGAGIR